MAPKIKIIILFLFLSVFLNLVPDPSGMIGSGSECVLRDALPQKACTPGSVLSLDTDLICQAGYSKQARNVPDSLKREIFESYGIPPKERDGYLIDHLVSLELGGGNDRSNLFPLPIRSEFIKSRLEDYLHGKVCSGEISLGEAQLRIAENWVTYYESVEKESASNFRFIFAPVTNKQPEVKKSETGFCHEKGSPRYDTVLKYEAYDSMEGCLDSGGRPLRD